MSMTTFDFSPRPIVPDPQYSFTLFSQQHPLDQQPGDKLDAENEQLRQTDREVIAWATGVVADDGRLRDRIVEPINLSDATYGLLTSGWNPRGVWQPDTEYRTGDFINYPDSSRPRPRPDGT